MDERTNKLMKITWVIIFTMIALLIASYFRNSYKMDVVPIEIVSTTTESSFISETISSSTNAN